MSYNVVVQYKPLQGLAYAKSTSCATIGAANARLSDIEKEENISDVEVYNDATGEKVVLVDGKIVSNKCVKEINMRSTCGWYPYCFCGDKGFVLNCIRKVDDTTKEKAAITDEKIVPKTQVKTVVT